MKKILTITLAIIMIFVFSLPIYASGFDPSTYTPPDIEGDETVMNMAKPIINAISVIGIVVAVITLIVIGLKYMTGSVAEKADYKKTMIPYIIGVVMLVGITQILKILVNLVSTVEMV